jgi:DNA topoisomerase-1
LNNSLQKATQAQQKEDFVGRKCPNCGGELIYRYTKSKGMRFIGCSNFQKCKYNEFPNQPQPKPTGLKCPDCGGDLIIKISKKKRKFIGCNNYPKCNFIMKTTPVIMKTIDKAMAQGAVPDVTVERAVIKAKTTENKEK